MKRFLLIRLSIIHCYLSVIPPKTQAVAGTPKDRALISPTHPVTSCSILNAVHLQVCLYTILAKPLFFSLCRPACHPLALPVTLEGSLAAPHPWAPFQVLADPTYGESADQRIKRVRTGRLFPQVHPCRVAWG